MNDFIASGAIRELKSLWSQAEDYAKRTEKLRLSLAVPSVNELRYAGYHLLCALTASDSANANEQLARSKKHCQRAIYDAVEAETLYYLGKIREFQGDYRTVNIEVKDFDYMALREAAKDANKLLHLVRGPDEEREEYLPRVEEHCAKLEGHVGRLSTAREELNKRQSANQEERADRLAKEAKGNRRWKIATAITIVGVAAGLGRWSTGCSKQDAGDTPATSIRSGSAATSVNAPQR